MQKGEVELKKIKSYNVAVNPTLWFQCSKRYSKPRSTKITFTIINVIYYFPRYYTTAKPSSKYVY